VVELIARGTERLGRRASSDRVRLGEHLFVPYERIGRDDRGEPGGIAAIANANRRGEDRGRSSRRDEFELSEIARPQPEMNDLLAAS